ncbi:pyruvate dehydrogenase (acetyl-transferring) E1 component subunit alpha [Halioxenophilus sp. WMMB6]|uniref:pyruvate dehydrogenase (acetyl-transferring) E1 component subunit alpha n=1 Tax=Halioxenophilus sp. WMMB6 TaxID=3073815 RepID=UPI00295F5068|nr:pyruvate dehydrogenase (acetyl-transferring) E1 component subunit alpha [Halioxenophilus sp. WMMB6]
MDNNFTHVHPPTLGPHGEVITPSRLAEIAPEQLLGWYRAMALTRKFDEKCVALQRTGQLGTYASCLGMEAIGVGLASAMQADDTYIPFYRDQAVQLQRGVSMEEILLYWSGDERGSHFQQCHDFPNTVCIATQCSQAAGVATSFKLRRQPRVAVCSLGDGATSKGDFSEALNVAGAWHLPLVVVIHNNQYAISVPRHKQSAARHLSDKALGAGIPGHQVDGNDVDSVYRVAHEAIERARAGKGASLIEAVTYRLGDHTTADDARRYRRAAEVQAAWLREPIARLRHYLESQGLWNKAKEAELQSDCQAQVLAAVERFKALPAQPATAMFDHLYEQLPEPLMAQYQQLQTRHCS